MDESSEKKSDLLVVEDSPTQAEHIKYILEKHGYGVAVAKNGKEAMDYLNTNLPSIIISDVVMPEIDGFELCKRIKADERPKNIPIILLATLLEPEDVIRGLESGADNFMTKPFNEEALIERIHYVLLNAEMRKNMSTDMGMEIAFAGGKHLITSSRIQMLDLLLSIYESAVIKNRELEKANRKLKEANEKIKTLSGLLPICSFCKKVRGDDGYWNKIETYIEAHSGAEFSHTMCLECARKNYPQIYSEKFEGE
jgi:two-component system cell cycle response regulator